MDENQSATDQTVVTPEPSTGEDKQVQEQPTEAPEQQVETPTESSTEGEDTSEEVKPSRQEKRQARYIDKLSKQLEDARAQGFQQQLNKPDQYNPIEYGEQEYPIEQLNTDRQKYGESQFNQGVNQAQQIAQTTVWQDSVERDNDYVDDKYPIMDENSDEYDPDIANYINQLYLQSTGYDGKVVKNPIKYREFVQANMELADRLKTQASAETASNVARQAAQTSVKTGSSSRRVSRDWSKPGAIAALSSDEYEKFKPEIEAWMKQNVNPNIR